VPDSVALRLEATTPLFSGPNWDYTGLRRVYDAIERIALDEIGLDVYPVQIEVIRPSRCSTPTPRSACR
jgi:spore cortex formation protein SpoVR/YcgB (stage V sporulation)